MKCNNQIKTKLTNHVITTSPCYKFTLGISFLGFITDFVGLHLGTTPDNTAFDEAVADGKIDFEDWEWAIADGIYNSCNRVMTK